MGCILNPIAKKAINVAISKVSDQLMVAERKLDSELREINNKIDHEVDQAVYKIEGEVSTKTREALSPFKEQVGAAVAVVKEPVDGVVAQFNGKVNLAAQNVKDIVNKPLNLLNTTIKEKKEVLRKEVLSRVMEVTKEKNFAAECAKDHEVGYRIEYNIRTSVAEVVDPKMAPFLEVVDGLITEAKENIRTLLKPPREPAEAIEGEIREAFGVVEKPLDEAYSEAYGIVSQIEEEIGEGTRELFKQSALATKEVTFKALDAAKLTFDTAAEKAQEGGNKAIEQAKVDFIVDMGKEQLSYAVQASKHRGHTNVDHTKSDVSWRLWRLEYENWWAIARLKAVPKRAMRETFAEVTKPIDDSKETVLGPINAVYKTLDTARDKSFTTMDNYRRKAASFSDDLVRAGCEAIIEALVQSGYRRATPVIPAPAPEADDDADADPESGAGAGQEGSSSSSSV